MKKIISVHISNKVFQMEDDAYAYLNNVLHGQWKKSDLEEQVSSKLEEKLNGRQVVTYPDVVDVLYQLGFSMADAQSISQETKKLYRQPKNKMIAGVCTGLGEYFNVDPVIVRILFLVALFMASVGFWLYIILWIIVPKAPKLLNA